MQHILLTILLLFTPLYVHAQDAQSSVELSEWPHALTQDIFNDISTLNAAELAKHFSASIEIIIPGEGSTVFSRKQAEVVISEFFATLPKDMKFIVEHETNAAEATLSIILLDNSQLAYRFFLISKPNANNERFIHQFKVEKA